MSAKVGVDAKLWLTLMVRLEGDEEKVCASRRSQPRHKRAKVIECVRVSCLGERKMEMEGLVERHLRVVTGDIIKRTGRVGVGVS